MVAGAESFDDAGEVDGSAALELAGLRKSFGLILAVDDVNLIVNPGEVVALLGPNGAGKSTLVDMVLGLAPPDRGTVQVWGRRPADACAAGEVGALLQTGGLLGLVTVRELLDLMRRLSPHPLPLDEVVGAARVGDILGQRADRLSGGQVQRVRFAMAIAGDPGLLVLDEPTVAMDVTTRRAFWAAMRNWTERGRTVMFATHYLEEADAYADRVVLMAHGRVVADGSTSEIKAAVGGRTIRAVVPGADRAALLSLPGVADLELRGEAVALRCTDSDAALRALLAAHPAAHRIEVAAAGLEEAFLALTDDRASSSPTTTRSLP